MKINLFIISILALALDMSAQEISEIFFPDNSIIYLGQLGTNGKEHNGMGVLKLKKGGIYAGDFSRDKFHGYGIMILPSYQDIQNCFGASIYVGKWFRGKKNGLGKLYDSKGNLIYKGKFVDDKPIDALSNDIDSLSRFSTTIIDDELYIGEILDGIPNGFGMFLDDDGFYTLCPVQNGVKNGVGLILNPPYNWGVFQFGNELYYQIATGVEQESRREKYKRNRDAERAQLLGTFCDILNEGISLANNFQNTMNPEVSEGQPANNYISEGKHSSVSTTSKGKYNLSEQQSYNSDKATYSKYDGMLSAAFAGNRNASASEIKQWQNKMKQLREKWEKKGRDFPHFPNEDK